MSENRFAMASDWMVNGNIREFVTACPGVDRLGLVGLPLNIALPQRS
jgi:hypothetical protein